jgi:hypothetical protein
MWLPTRSDRKDSGIYTNEGRLRRCPGTHFGKDIFCGLQSFMLTFPLCFCQKNITLFLGKVRDEDTLVRAASRIYIKKRLAYKEWARECVHLSTLPLGKRRREAQQSVNMLCVKKDRLTLLFKVLERFWPRFMEEAASRGEFLLVEHYYH